MSQIQNPNLNSVSPPALHPEQSPQAKYVAKLQQRHNRLALIGQARGMYMAGLTMQAIANKLGLHRNTVSAWAEKYRWREGGLIAQQNLDLLSSTQKSLLTLLHDQLAALTRRTEYDPKGQFQETTIRDLARLTIAAKPFLATDGAVASANIFHGFLTWLQTTMPQHLGVVQGTLLQYLQHKYPHLALQHSLLATCATAQHPVHGALRIPGRRTLLAPQDGADAQ